MTGDKPKNPTTKIIPTHPNLVGYVLQQGFKEVYLNDGLKKSKKIYY